MKREALEQEQADIAAGLAAQIDALGIDSKEIYTAIGVSKSTYSLLMQGKYLSAKAKDYYGAIKNYIEKYSAAKAADTAPFMSFAVKPQERAQKLLEIALNAPTMGLLTGQSGSGKTHTCKSLANKPEILYVKLRKNLTPAAIVDLMCIALRGHSSGGNTNSKFNGLITDLKNRKIKMIIADEVDMFCDDTKYSFIKKFEVFRELYENGFSVMLVGLTRLEDKLRSIGEDYIVRRIKLAYSISIRREDIEGYYDYLGLPDCPEKDGIIERAFNNGNFGILKNIQEQYELLGDIRLANELVFMTKSL